MLADRIGHRTCSAVRTQRIVDESAVNVKLDLILVSLYRQRLPIDCMIGVGRSIAQQYGPW